MLLRDIKKKLNCKLLTRDSFLDEKIHYCFAADLMSDVLRYARTGSLLLTGITNIQVLQVSEILDLKGILFVRGKLPEKEVIDHAIARRLPLLSTNNLMFDSCGVLYSLGLKGGKSRLSDQNESRDLIQTII